MGSNLNRGSIWRKWDLHLHTPTSYDYKDGDVTNEQIIKGLKDNSIAVVAITDHHTIDVDRIKKLQELGAKEHITVLPGIEFCSESRGDRPIHFIGIFSESSDISYVWDEINSKSNIAKQRQAGKSNNQVYCKLEDTCKLIKDLGGVISVHAGSKTNSIENITNSLPVRMAEKKDLVGNIDIFELGKEVDQAGYRDKVFPKIENIIPMIICSDNHMISKYDLKAPCWIKADPTFEGLKQILIEPADRVHIGDIPPQKENAEKNGSKFINSIGVHNINRGSNTNWFDDDIHLNTGLVAIIGNKGSGKSALADIIALCGKSHIGRKQYSFLNADKFLKNQPARYYGATIDWCDESKEILTTLEQEVDARTEVEMVKYLPQKYVEDICNEVEVTEKFQDEIDKVVFAYVPDTDNHGLHNLRSLIDYQTKAIDSKISSTRQAIGVLIGDYLALDKKKREEYAESLENKLKQKQNELNSLKQPEKVEKPPEEVDAGKRKKIDELASQVEKLTARIKETENNLKQINTSMTDFNNIVGAIDTLERESRSLKEELGDFSKRTNISVDGLLELSINREVIASIKNALQSKQTAYRYMLNLIPEDEKDSVERNFVRERSKVRKELDEIRNSLKAPQRAYEEYVKSHKNFVKKQDEVVGKPGDKSLETIESIKSEMKYVQNDLEDARASKYTDLFTACKVLYTEIDSKVSIYKTLYKPLNDFIAKEQSKLELENNALTFEVGVTLAKADFSKKFLGFINRTAKGSFRGRDESQTRLKDILGRLVLSSKEEVKNFLNELMTSLTEDKTENDAPRIIGSQLVSGEDKERELYEYVFGLDYLDVKFKILFNGKDLNNNELSPGEKGATLLIFYLLIEKENCPLIIDQPEENLDNESVVELLVPCIKEAKKRRQVIIVTHNPNLAVVCDAEQIIHSSMDKQNNEIRYSAGSIENPKINKRLIDILEGKMPAFRKRDSKYQ